MSAPVQPNKTQLSSCEAEIYQHSGTVGVSAVREYIELRKIEVQKQFMYADNMVDVSEMQGRIRELDDLLRIIETGPYKPKER